MVIAEEWATRGKHEFLVATSPLSPPLFLLMSPTFSGHFRIRTFASNLSFSQPSPALVSHPSLTRHDPDSGHVLAGKPQISGIPNLTYIRVIGFTAT